ncbi:hypothetical protein V6N12_021379 [Hibiscus sabdariffa]|uniref:Uncharacterized protein n=1 Tax=Hibiscus sabdariffa TaxID=183260 RepID=A0ABR2FRH5_9ROSI
MSSRRSRQSSAGVSRISDDQIIELVSKLRQLLPEIRDRRSDKVSASKVLQETCNYIRSLHREVDDLSERLSQLLATIDADSAEAAIIRSLIILTRVGFVAIWKDQRVVFLLVSCLFDHPLSRSYQSLSFFNHPIIINHNRSRSGLRHLAWDYRISTPIDSFWLALSRLKTMYPGGYTAEITTLSPKVTEKDLRDFFSYCGAIEHVEIIRCGEYACTAYVTFKDAYSLETAVLLSGGTIVDQSVCITRWGSYDDDSYPWDGSSWKTQEDAVSTVTHMHPFVSSPGEAVTVVKTMLAKGYVLGKDALVKAKDLDESYRVSATAAAKVAELSNRIGLTDKINTSMETVKSVDEKYHVSDITKSVASVTGTAVLTAASFTGRTAVSASNAVVNSSYFAKGALWVSGMLNHAAQAAADLGSHGDKQTPS